MLKSRFATLIAADINLTQLKDKNERQVLAVHEIQGELNKQGARRKARELSFRRCWNQMLQSH